MAELLSQGSSLASLPIEDVIYWLASAFLLTCVSGSLAYDMSVPKTLPTIVQTGGFVYAPLTLPLVIYSGLQVFMPSLAFDLTVKRVYMIYLAAYTAALSVFMYLFYSMILCGVTTGGVFPYYDEVESYLCGTTTGYLTQEHYTALLIFTYGYIGVQVAYWAEQIYVTYVETGNLIFFAPLVIFD